MATLDPTTLAEYAVLSTASERAQAVVDALASNSPAEVTVNIRTGGSPDIVATGTIAAPWATESSGTITVGDANITVSAGGTPDSDWYIEFTNGTRWVHGTFGLSGTEFTWSLPTFEAGQTATLGDVYLTTVSSSAPEFTVAPASASIASTGGTIQFTATDADGDTVSYSLPSTRAGITINATTGLVTVTSAAAGTSGSITVRASDGALTADAVCAVTVESGFVVAIHTNFGSGMGFKVDETWTGTYAGGYYGFYGTDASTGQSFATPPTIYGQNPSLSTTAFQIIVGSGYTAPSVADGSRDLSSGAFYFRCEDVTGPSGTGITTALYIQRRVPYANAMQTPLVMHPNPSLMASGMYYIRYYRRYASGHFTATATGGTTFNAVMGSKSVDGSGPSRPLYVQHGSGGSLVAFADSTSGSASGSDTYRGSTFSAFARHPVDGTNTQHTVATLTDNTWHKIEIAFRPSRSDSVGFQWVAINGVQTLFVQGRTIPDIRVEGAGEIYPVQYYLDGSQNADSRLGVWITGLKVCEGWPSDAAPHPNVE